MTGKAQLYFCNQYGKRISSPLEAWNSATYTKVLGEIGVAEISFPAGEYKDFIRKDRIIEIEEVIRGKPVVVNAFFMRRFIERPEEDIVVAFDPNYLLTGRIVKDYSGSSQAEKTGYADDLIKEIISEQLGASAGAFRDLSSRGLLIEADLSQGANITKAFFSKTVKEALDEICRASANKGNYIFYDLTAIPSKEDEALNFYFQTFLDYKRDLSSSSSIPSLLGERFGNTANEEYEEDYENEINFIYAAGQGEGADREIETAEDTSRSSDSVWARREGFVDARQDDIGSLADKAYSALEAGFGKKRFSCDIQESYGFSYGLNYDVGDKLSVEFRGRSFDAILKGVKLDFFPNRRKQVSAKFQVE